MMKILKQNKITNLKKYLLIRLEEMSHVPVTQVKNISIVMDLYNKIIINDKNNIIALTK